MARGHAMESVEKRGRVCESKKGEARRRACKIEAWWCATNDK